MVGSIILQGVITNSAGNISNIFFISIVLKDDYKLAGKFGWGMDRKTLIRLSVTLVAIPGKKETLSAGFLHSYFCNLGERTICESFQVIFQCSRSRTDK